jgi:hypothetical protein
MPILKIIIFWTIVIAVIVAVHRWLKAMDERHMKRMEEEEQ